MAATERSNDGYRKDRQQEIYGPFLWRSGILGTIISTLMTDTCIVYRLIALFTDIRYMKITRSETIQAHSTFEINLLSYFMNLLKISGMCR